MSLPSFGRYQCEQGELSVGAKDQSVIEKEAFVFTYALIAQATMVVVGVNFATLIGDRSFSSTLSTTGLTSLQRCKRVEIERPSVLDSLVHV